MGVGTGLVALGGLTGCVPASLSGSVETDQQPIQALTARVDAALIRRVLEEWGGVLRAATKRDKVSKDELEKRFGSAKKYGHQMVNHLDRIGHLKSLEEDLLRNPNLDEGSEADHATKLIYEFWVKNGLSATLADKIVQYADQHKEQLLRVFLAEVSSKGLRQVMERSLGQEAHATGVYGGVSSAQEDCVVDAAILAATLCFTAIALANACCLNVICRIFGCRAMIQRAEILCQSAVVIVALCFI